ncbi:MAG: indole-3-glycerol-phosphate synthase [Methanomicrobia archaeon]|nr:indole-3-glycerol-phosphate synthase [Methanomicrobia archaeon]
MNRDSNDLIDRMVKDTKLAVERRREERIPERKSKVLRLSNAIKKNDKAIIAEIKPRSPTTGDLIGTRDIVSIAREYEAGCATALSVLTSTHFGGEVANVSRVKGNASIPVLYKDFVVDEYQILEAFGYGADAVLLIEGISPVEQLLDVVGDLGLEAVVECHSAEEIESAVSAGADIIGINNRDLRTLTVDIETTARLSEYVPGDTILISESGVKTSADARYLFDCGADALLIGTALMQSEDPKEFIKSCITA